MRPFFWLSFALNAFSSAYAYATPSRTIQKRAASNFISTQGDKFVVNGRYVMNFYPSSLYEG